MTVLSEPAIQQPKKKRIRQSSKPLLNKLETEFKEYLEQYKMHWVLSQSIRFKLGNGIWYKPDFVVMQPALSLSPIVCYEVKGPHAYRGGLENLKVAAGQYKYITWILCWKGESGNWEFQTVLP